MMKRISSWLCLFIVAVIWLWPASVWAATFDSAREGSITLQYAYEGKGFENLEIQIYRVAEMKENSEFQPIEPFSSYPVNMEGITSQKEWKMAAETMAAYIIANQVKPDYVGKTDAEGIVRFNSVQTGLYLVRKERIVQSKNTYVFEDSFVYLPMYTEYDYDYEIEAKLKYTKMTEKPDKPDKPVKPKPPQEPTKPNDPTEPGEPKDDVYPLGVKGIQDAQFTVVKLWKDYGSIYERPASVEISIYRDGMLWEEVELNSENNWSYIWLRTSLDETWSVVEKDVPEGYTVTISENNNTFVITNSSSAQVGVLPATGDTFPLWPIILVMCLSGLLLVIIGVWSKRKEF